MHNYQAIATAYLDTFNATDPAERKRLVAEHFREDVSYVDPMAEISGHDQLAAFIAGAQEQFPGWTFSLVGTVDGHHNRARFSWALGPEGEEAPVLGFDVIHLDDESNITAVHGFLDRVPSA